MKHRRHFVSLAALVALVIGVGAAAADPGNGNGKGGPPVLPDPAQVRGSFDAGAGTAPGAPAAVAEHVAAVKAGQLGRPDQGDLSRAPDFRSTQSVRRTRGAGCWTVWARRNFDNWLFGYNYWRYYEQVSWCGDGSALTSFWRDRWPDVNWIGWEFRGHIDSNCSLEHCNGRGSGTYSTYAWTQGAFAVCAAWCADWHYPIVSISVNADGGWGYSTSD